MSCCALAVTAKAASAAARMNVARIAIFVIFVAPWVETPPYSISVRRALARSGEMREGGGSAAASIFAYYDGCRALRRSRQTVLTLDYKGEEYRTHDPQEFSPESQMERAG